MPVVCHQTFCNGFDPLLCADQIQKHLLSCLIKPPKASERHRTIQSSLEVHNIFCRSSFTMCMQVRQTREIPCASPPPHTHTPLCADICTLLLGHTSKILALPFALAAANDPTAALRVEYSDHVDGTDTARGRPDSRGRNTKNNKLPTNVHSSDVNQYSNDTDSTKTTATDETFQGDNKVFFFTKNVTHGKILEPNESPTWSQFLYVLRRVRCLTYCVSAETTPSFSTCSRRSALHRRRRGVRPLALCRHLHHSHRPLQKVRRQAPSAPAMHKTHPCIEETSYENPCVCKAVFTLVTASAFSVVLGTFL